MTRRQTRNFFAGHAVEGLLAGKHVGVDEFDKLVMSAFKIADQMVEAATRSEKTKAADRLKKRERREPK